MSRFLLNNKGNTLIGALVAMTVLASAAASVVYLSSTDNRSSTDYMQKQQAAGVANAGIQYSLDKLNHGYSPNVTGMDFDPGEFDVSTDAASSLVTSTGRVGEAEVTQSINADFTKDCMDQFVSSGYISGSEIKEITLSKNCNLSAILSKVHLSWNWSNCATQLNCDGEEIAVDPDASVAVPVYETISCNGNGKFTICHVPPGNPGNKHTLCVNHNGWENGHSHGTGAHSMDYLGECIVGYSYPNCTGNVVNGVCEALFETSCENEGEASVDLENCAQDDGDATVTKITLGGTTVFEADVTPSNLSAATESGAETDVADAQMSNDEDYLLNITFSEVIPSGAWFDITTEFSDGSMLSGELKAGQNADPEAIPPDDAVAEEEEESEGFDVENGVVIVDPSYTVTLQVIGSAITCGTGGPEVNVRAQLCINSTCSQLWGYTDLDGGEAYTTTNSVADSEYVVQANAYLASCGGFNRTYDSTNTTQVKTLRDGETPPNLAGYGGQASVTAFLAPYLDASGNININSNQVIYLFELGTTSMNTSAADFQDLVVLMTVSANAQ